MIRVNSYALVRRLLAILVLLAMAAVFFVPAAARWVGWLPRLQLVPAILAGAVLELAVLVLLVALFGRLYCAVICPLGIAQDLFRFCFGWSGRLVGATVRRVGKGEDPSAVTRRAAASTGGRILFSKTMILRYAILVLFVLAIPLGLTGLIEPYGIFGRFLTVGIRRLGEPATVTIAWSVSLFALILVLSLFRARFWCNRICPVGTFLGLFSRFALFRVRIDADACVTCGACVKRCDKGALAVRADKSIAVDPSVCIACGNCFTVCPKAALTFAPRARTAS